MVKNFFCIRGGENSVSHRSITPVYLNSVTATRTLPAKTVSVTVLADSDPKSVDFNPKSVDLDPKSMNFNSES
jgi:hypothetical protein